MGSRELFQRNPFADRTLGEDTDLQRRLVSDGARLLSRPIQLRPSSLLP